MVTVSYFHPTLAREGATHDALDGERTACGRRIDYGLCWVNLGKPITCKRCIGALKRATQVRA